MSTAGGQAAGRPSPVTDRLPRLSPQFVLLELVILLIAALWATSAYFPRQGLQFPGYEAEWLTSPAYLSAESFRNNGYIPLWQPYLGTGQPTIEHPFSFLLNPISTLPSLLLGAETGIFVSVILSVILTGWSGWLLGRVLGLGILGRVLLGLLCIGKGNLHAMLSAGGFQLGTAQAYLPLILAGAVAMFRLSHRRWPIVLTSIGITLMWWTGGLWFVLPTLVMVVILLGFQIFRVKRDRVQFNGTLFNRTLWLLALTIGLTAVSWLPLLSNRASLIVQPNVNQVTAGADVLRVVEQFFNGDPTLYDRGLALGLPQVYYSYVFPWWLALLIVALLPIRWLYDAPFSQTQRIWLPALVIIALCIGWVAIGNIPILSYWQFPGRVLAIASLWIAVLVALRIDGLWRAVVINATWIKRLPAVDQVEQFKPLLAASIVLLAAVGAFDVISTWSAFAQPTQRDTQLAKSHDDDCLTWLREGQLALPSVLAPLDYSSVLAYTTNGLRRANLAVDIDFAARAGTLYDADLLHTLPRYAIAPDEAQRATLKQMGYLELRTSPLTDNHAPCLHLKPDAFPYAFSIPSTQLDSFSSVNPLVSLRTTPILQVWHGYDRIGLLVDVQPTDALIVTVQETNYPGWQVWINDQPARLDSIGGQIGVRVPAIAGLTKVYFQYLPQPFFIGAWLTLIAVGVAVLYLLRADRLLPSSINSSLRDGSAGLQSRLGKVATSIGRSLTQPIDDQQE
jgi:hypothetical protein